MRARVIERHFIDDVSDFLIHDCEELFLLYFDVNIAPTPKMDAVSKRNCATRYRTESCICPGGGVMKPAMPKPTAATNDAMAMVSWILEAACMSGDFERFIFLSFDGLYPCHTFAVA